MSGIKGIWKTTWTSRKGPTSPWGYQEGSQRIVLHQPYKEVCAVSRCRWGEKDEKGLVEHPEVCILRDVWSVAREDGVKVSYLNKEMTWHFTCCESHSESREQWLERHKSRGRVDLLHKMRRKMRQQLRWWLRGWRKERISERAGMIHCTWTWFNVCTKESVREEQARGSGGQSWLSFWIWCLWGTTVV